MSEEPLNILKDIISNAMDAPKKSVYYSTFSERQNIRVREKRYWETVKKWENETGKKFEDIVGELRKKTTPDEVIKTLEVSRSFIYYHFGHAMNRILYLEKQHGKPLREIIFTMREQGFTMNKISDELGLTVSTLYNHIGSA